MMCIALVLALPPPAVLISTTYDDENCPRRDCPVKTLMPQMGATSEAVDERFLEHPSMLRIRQNLPPVSVEHTAQKLDETTSLLNLEQFQDYWQVSHNDLALLTDAPIDTVKNWFRANPTRRLHPNYQHLHRLALAHKYWVQHLNR